MPERKILNIKSSPPLAETVGLLRGALEGMGIFAHSAPDPNRPKLSESYCPIACGVVVSVMRHRTERNPALSVSAYKLERREQ